VADHDDPDAVDSMSRGEGSREDAARGTGGAVGAKRARARSAVHGEPTRRHAAPIGQRGRPKADRARAGSPAGAGRTTTGTRPGTEQEPGPAGNGKPQAARLVELISPARRSPREEIAEKRLTAKAMGPFRRPWREEVFVKVTVLDHLNVVLPPAPPPAPSAEGISRRLELAWHAACHRGGLRPGPNRARMERAYANIDEAAAGLLHRTPEPHLRGQIPGLVSHVRAHLPPAHTQRVAVEALGSRRRSEIDPLDDDDRALLVDATRTASAAARREHARLRSFCAIVNTTSVLLFLLAVLAAAVGAVRPEWIPLCSQPDPALVVCPTGSATGTAATLAGTARSGDVVVVMLLGLLAAAVTAAAAIRRIRGTSTPFAVPVALLALKLPTGALTAFLGLILLNGQFVPGLSALDTSGQILAWALIFGAAQQLVTGLVDKRAQSVLDATGANPLTTDKE
jgi:hypothetical protein